MNGGLWRFTADAFGPHEISRWPFIPLALVPLIPALALLAYLKLRRIL